MKEPLLPQIYMEALKNSIDLHPPFQRRVPTPPQPLPVALPAIGKSAVGGTKVTLDAKTGRRIVVAVAAEELAKKLRPKKPKGPKPPTGPKGRRVRIAGEPKKPAAKKAEQGTSPPQVDLTGDLGAMDDLEGGDEQPEDVKKAAKEFDERHVALSNEAHALLKKVGRSKRKSKKEENDFQAALDNLRRNRFYTDTPLEVVVVKKPEARRKKRNKWKLEDSCWVPRQYYGLMETEDCARKHFLLDWEIARRSHGLEKHIIKMDDRECGLMAQDADGDGTLDEVEEVRGGCNSDVTAR